MGDALQKYGGRGEKGFDDASRAEKRFYEL